MYGQIEDNLFGILGFVNIRRGNIFSVS